MPETDILTKVITEGAPGLVVMLALVWALYRLGLRAMDLHYQHLTRNVLPLYERGAASLEKLAEAGDTLVKQIGEDHKILFASVRGVHAEMKELRETHEAAENN